MKKIKFFALSLVVFISLFTLSSVVSATDATCSSQANPQPINLGSSSNITWVSTDADSCDTGGNGTGISGSFNVTPPLGGDNVYPITCIRNAKNVSGGPCTGTYTPSVSSCVGMVSGSFCSGGGNPYEGDDCGEFVTQAECPGNIDPWCHHGCHWQSGSGSAPCSDFTLQSSCTSHVGCTWGTGYQIPFSSAKCDATVTTRSVTLEGNGSLGPLILPPGTNVVLTVDTTGMLIPSPTPPFTCDIKRNNSILTGTFCFNRSPGEINPCSDTTPNTGGPFTYSATCKQGVNGESDNSNNVILHLSNQPDLTVGAVSPNVVLIPMGQNSVTTDLNATIMNQSPTTATGADFPYFFQIADNAAGTNAQDFPSSTMGALNPNGTDIAIFHHTFTEGTYYVQACADKSSSAGGSVIPESDEDNNCSGFTQVQVVQTGTGTLPDLIAYPALPYNAVAGMPVNFTATIRNQGSVDTGSSFWNFFQVQSGGTGSGGSGGAQSKSNSWFRRIFNIAKAAGGTGGSSGQLIDLTPVQMSHLGSNTSSTTHQNYIFDTAGTYSVRACADKMNRTDAGLVNESNENNNCGTWQTITVTPGAPQSKPDLTAGVITPTVAQTNQTTTFSAVISNIGAVSTGGSFTDLIQLGTLDAGGHLVVTDAGTQLESALAAGTNYTLSISERFTHAGSYNARICADKANKNDANGVISESNELNNCGPWTTITVSDEAVASEIGVNLSANKTALTLPDNSVRLSWTTSGSPDSCSASNSPQGLWNGTKNAQGGTENVFGMDSGTYTFAISCKKGTPPNVLTADSTVVVSVYRNPNDIDVTLTSDKTTINPGEKVILDWVTAGNPDTCIASSIPGTTWDGSKTTASGTEEVGGFDAEGIYALKIVCQKGTATKTSTVAVSVGSARDVLCSPFHFGCLAGALVTNSGSGGSASGWAWQCQSTNGSSKINCTESATECANGASNPPDCTVGGCSNGATNPPQCTTVGGSCMNEGVNPPQCDTDSAGNCIAVKALNYQHPAPCKYKKVPVYIER